MSFSKVSVVKCSGEERRTAMGRLIQLLGLPETAKRIAIKLNLCDYRKWESGATSDPNVVGALLHVLRDRYPRAELMLCENDSCDTLVENIWGYLGLDKVAARYDTSLVSLSKSDWVKVR